MDFLLGIFSEQLSTYINGFRKEQVTASLLTGKGEISDVHINVDPLNKLLSKIVRFVELSSVHVSKLSFNVTSLTNLKQAPIEISIDEVCVYITEPLAYASRDSKWSELSKSAVEEAVKRGSYGLLDRIGDNITVDINRIYITFQPIGKFKTKRVGPWTPPALSIVLDQMRFVSVDEYGEEGPPSAIWRHNSRSARRMNNARQNLYVDSNRASMPRTIMIFKKLSMGCTIAVGKRKEGMSVKDTFFQSTCLLKNVPVQIHIAMHKRLRDASLLAIQADVSLINVEVDLDLETISLLIHALVGIQYCVTKDRQFNDPLISNEKNQSNSTDDNAPQVQILEAQEDAVQVDLKDSDIPLDEGSEEDDDDSNEVDDMSARDGSLTEASNFKAENRKSMLKFRNSNEDTDGWPAIVTPFGIIIQEKLCVSLSIHDVAIRVNYDKSKDGYFQFSAKGAVAEGIWPKIEGQKDGIMQLSLSYICLQECRSRSIRTLLVGGMDNDKHMDSPPGVSPEENFPMLEQRPVRRDPIDLRSTYPIQAFGCKASIVFTEESSETKIPFTILLEVGVNNIEMSFDSERWGRLSTFYHIDKFPGYDNRWFSGDWSDDISDDILSVSSTSSFDFQEYIQTVENFTKEVIGISPDMINLTAKMTTIRVRIPAPLGKDLENSDVIISLGTIMLLISSALPRGFLSNMAPGNGHNQRTDNEKENLIQFPNDPKDVEWDQVAPNNDDQSPLRMQCTISGFKVRALPLIPFLTGEDPLTLMSSSNINLLLGMEKDHVQNSSTNFIFSTIQLLDSKINIDLEVISSIVGTMIYHVEYLSEVAKTMGLKIPPNTDDAGMKHIVIASRLSISKVSVNFWRQHVPLPMMPQNEYLPILLLLSLDVEGFEAGIKVVNPKMIGQVDSEGPPCHLLTKLSLAKVSVSICDVESIISKMSTKTETSSKAEEDFESGHPCLDIFLLEKETGKGHQNEEVLLLRAEYFSDKSQCCTLGVELSSGKISFDIEKVDNFVSFAIDMLSSQIPQFRVFQINGALKEYFPEPKSSNLVDSDTEKDGLNNDEGGKLEHFLEAVGLILVRVSLENFSLAIPHVSTKTLALVLEKSSIKFGFFGENNGAIKESILNVSSGIDKLLWADLFQSRSIGFHHNVYSRQKCLLLSKNGDASTENAIVKSFSIESKYQPSSWSGLMTNCSLSLCEMTLGYELYLALKRCEKHGMSIRSKISDATFALGEGLQDPPPFIMSDTPISTICRASSEALNITKTQFEEMKDEVQAYIKEHQEVLDKKQTEIDHLRSKIFQIERERLTARSLVSCHVSGVVRMGGTGFSRQRLVSTTNMWKYWAVLRDSYLVVLNTFSDTIPVDIISLQGAKLHAVSGGGRKRDLQRSFAIVDASGQQRFFLLESNEQYEMWVHSISKAIDIFGNFDASGGSGGGDTQSLPEDTTNGDYKIISVASLDDDGNESSKGNTKIPISAVDLNLESENEIGDHQVVDEVVDVDAIAEEKISVSESFVTEDSESIQSEQSDLQDDNSIRNDSPRRRSKLRDKMSKIGSSVKSLKIDRAAIKKLNSKSFTEKLPSRRKAKLDGQAPKDEMSDSNRIKRPIGKALKMKSLRVDEEEPKTNEILITAKPVMLKSVEDPWIIQVHVESPQEAESNHDTSEKDKDVPSSSSDLQPLCFRISSKCFNGAQENEVIVKKQILDVLHFHSQISEIISTAPRSLVNKSIETDLLGSGNILQGFLNHQGNRNEQLLQFMCDTFVTFLNALMSKPIPEDAHGILLSFLGIPNDNGETSPPAQSMEDKSEEMSAEIRVSQTSLEHDPLSSFKKCASALDFAERKLLHARKLASNRVHEPLLPNRENENEQDFKSKTYTEAVHDALNSVMAERDEAHVQLVALRVLHTHELEQEKRKTRLLTKKLELSEKLCNQDTAAAAAFFLGQEEIPDKDSLSKIEKEMVQNTDAELLALCRQLSSEISARVSAELEVVRVKESGKIESDLHASQCMSLREELSEYKTKLRQEKELRASMDEEKEKWRRSFLELVDQNSKVEDPTSIT